MENAPCYWQDCKFNHNCICAKSKEIFPVSHSAFNYERIWDKNTKEIKENCRCLTFDIAQYKETHKKFCKEKHSKMSLETWYFTYINHNEPELLRLSIMNDSLFSRGTIIPKF